MSAPRHRQRRLTISLLAPAALALVALLTGCGATPSVAASSPTIRSTLQTAPGAPPATALMVCGPDITGKVVQALHLPSAPATTHSWTGSLYTCTYQLPAGPMTLSVRVLPSPTAAHNRLTTDRTAAGTTATLNGLGQAAYATPTGTAVVLKDDQILTVDTTALPAVFGTNDQKRTDLANEIASDVLGCWTGDE